LPVTTEAIALGPLAGVALAHKDIFTLQGRAPGCGADRGHADASSRAAEVIDQLTRAGAVQLATLMMAPYACGSTAENPCFSERVVNPLAATAAVGGSSSGSAVAVASGLCYGSLGTDTAGSVRIPAATCGVLGLKTTAGLLNTDGVMPLAPSLDTVGLMTRTPDDAAALLRVLAPQLDNDSRAIATEPLRIGARLHVAQIADEVAAALLAFAKSADARAAADDAIAEHDELTRLTHTLLYVEAARTHGPRMQRGLLPASAAAVALPGLAVPNAWYAAALAGRASRARAFAARYFSDCDVLLLPALPDVVPEWDQVDTRSPAFQSGKLLALHRFMGFVNYLGFPALVCPIATDSRGLPICVQALARPFHEHALLRFAREATRHQFGEGGFLAARVR
jgi:aspartyl-tRNA(Asn)/glutamyl-tRNA(Gln) amidotransferase subunit A